MSTFQNVSKAQVVFFDDAGAIIGRTDMRPATPHTSQKGNDSMAVSLMGAKGLDGMSTWGNIYVGPPRDNLNARAGIKLANASGDAELAAGILEKLPETRDKVSEYLAPVCRASRSTIIRLFAKYPDESIVKQLAGLANVPAEGLYPDA